MNEWTDGQMRGRLALTLFSELLQFWMLFLSPQNLSFVHRQKKPSSVLEEKGTSTSQGEKICVSR